ncbi:MAG: hypothetical protein AAAB13_06185 [Pseudomonas sp.]
MDEINPYAAPGSALRPDAPVAHGRPFGYDGYKWCSLVYGALFVIICLVFMYQRGPAVSVFGTVALLIILSPLISYLLVAARSPRLFYAWLSMHLVGLLILVAFGIERMDSADGFKLGLTVFMISASLLSWLASLYFHWRLDNN